MYSLTFIHPRTPRELQALSSPSFAALLAAHDALKAQGYKVRFWNKRGKLGPAG